jgi:hypothetical protein
LLLLFGAVGEDVLGDEPAVHLVAETAFSAGSLGLHDGELVSQRPTAAAVLLRNGCAQQTEFAGLVPEIAVHALLCGPALAVWQRLGLEELGRHLLEGNDVVVGPG